MLFPFASRALIHSQSLATVSSVDYIRGLKNNESVLIIPSDLPVPYSPVACVLTELSNEGWYRLATGPRNYNMGAIINIGHSWGYSGQTACIFSLLAANAMFLIHPIDGYGDKGIDKIRYVQNPDNLVSNTYIDVHYIRNKPNDVVVSASCISHLSFVPTLEPATIPEGYTTTEVHL